jgi:hypothetical protein
MTGLSAKPFATEVPEEFGDKPTGCSSLISSAARGSPMLHGAIFYASSRSRVGDFSLINFD